MCNEINKHALVKANLIPREAHTIFPSINLMESKQNKKRLQNLLLLVKNRVALPKRKDRCYAMSYFLTAVLELHSRNSYKWEVGRVRTYKHTIPSPASSVTMVKVAVLLATPYTRPGPYADTLPLLG